MVKSVLTPAHPHSLEVLLEEPFTRTLDRSTPHRQSQVFVLRIVDMIPVPLQVRIQRRQRIPCGVRQALDRQGLDQVWIRERADMLPVGQIPSNNIVTEQL